MPFGYFGSKRRLAPTYPLARFDTIVEPFAGAAAYSLRGDHWTRNVILIDNDPDVVMVWKWLQDASENDVASLPIPTPKEPYPVEKGSPGYFLMRWGNGTKAGNVNIAGRFNSFRPAAIARQLHKIRHWQIVEGDYTDAPDVEATWFIDPPYQHFGRSYGAGDINFASLGEWCQSRRGQVIVCEQEPADWLPFERHVTNRTQSNNYVSELIWTNEPALRLF